VGSNFLSQTLTEVLSEDQELLAFPESVLDFHEDFTGDVEFFIKWQHPAFL
jgi:hypothetical protein